MLAEEREKGKRLSLESLRPFVVPAIVVLVGLSAFALGRLSALGGPVPAASSANIGQ